MPGCTRSRSLVPGPISSLAWPGRALPEHPLALDLIHSHGSSALTVTAIELTAGRIPVVHDLEDAKRNRNGSGNGDHRDVDRRAVEECSGLVVPSQDLCERLRARFILPALTCVFPSYALAHELPPDERHHSAEANIGRIAVLYESVSREPMAGLRRNG